MIDAPPPTLSIDRLPGAVWDPRIGRYRAPAARHRELREELLHAGVEFADDVHRPQPAPGHWLEPALRPYQRAAVAAWQRAARRGVVALPTGSGKTRVAVAAIGELGVSTLCLVPTRVLLDPWRRELGRASGQAIGCFGDGQHHLEPITVATLASAERQMPQIGGRFELLVVDEAHHAAGFEELFSMCTAASRLGLTATPPRDPDAADRLAELIGPTVYECALGELAGRFLAPLDVRAVELELTPAERARYDREIAAFREVYGRFRALHPSGSWADFARAAERSDEGKRALAAWRRARRLLSYSAGKRAALAELLAWHAGAKVLVFTADNEAAYAISRQHLIMPITCDIKRAERERALAAFARGELCALVSSRVLNEGVDVPDAEIGIILGGTLGEREHVQRIGRLLRPGPGKRAIVYELVARDTADARQMRQRRRGLEIGAFA